MEVALGGFMISLGGITAALGGAAMLFFLLLILVVVVLAVFGCLVNTAMYFFTALPTYQIAKRRKNHFAWIAWIPGLYAFVHGMLADSYREKTQQKTTRFFWMMLISYAVSWVFMGLFWLFYPILLFGTAVPLLGILLWIIAAIPLGIATSLSTFWMVLRYIALFDIYRSCQPRNAVLYLVLSILLMPCEPVFLMLCYKDDLGMPSNE